MSNNRYSETLDFLYTQLPMFQRVGAPAMKKDLSNTLVLLEYLDNPHRKFTSIHIAGTNGKGSVTHMLGAVLQGGVEKQRRVGLYTSPHYRDFRERIKINDDYITESAVVDFVDRCRPAIGEIRPSFFEITVAMAFDYFARQKVDVAVVETGLGGRLDSTNVLIPILSIITNISYDHQQFLGDTLPKIAGEKAGIIKQRVPVVIGETQSETKSVFDAKAVEQEAPVIFADRHYRAEVVKEDLGRTFFDVFRNEKLIYQNLELDAAGPYQHKNLQTVLQSVELLRESFYMKEDQIRYGLAHLRALTRFIGRWQVIGEHPTILCDSAHNEGGLRLVAERLEKLDYDRLHMVIGTVNDKDVRKMLSLLPSHATYYFARPNIPRGLEAERLQKVGEELGLKGDAYPSVAEALAAAKAKAGPEDLVFVGGSIFVVAEVI